MSTRLDPTDLSESQPSDPMGQRASTVRSPYLPMDILAVIFSHLPSSDRRRASLVCSLWHSSDAASRRNLSLHALPSLPLSLFSRFSSVNSLVLSSHPHSPSVSDRTLTLIALHCPFLTSLKLRCCRDLSASGVAGAVAASTSLRRISLKRLRFGSGAVSEKGSLEVVEMEEVENGQELAVAVAGGVRSVRISKCGGDWGSALEEIGRRSPELVEIRLDRVRVQGLSGLTGCCPKLEVLVLSKTLEVSNSDLEAVGLRCGRLRTVRLDGWSTNRIGDDGVSALVKGCPELEEIVLFAVEVSVFGFNSIAENCRKLKSFGVYASRSVGDDEIECVASGFAGLKKLCLKGCNLSDRGVAALEKGCPELRELKVKKCRKVTKNAIDSLREKRRELVVCYDSGEGGNVDAVANGISSSSVGGGSSTDVSLVSPVGSVVSIFKSQFWTGKNIVACTMKRLSSYNKQCSSS